MNYKKALCLIMGLCMFIAPALALAENDVVLPDLSGNSHAASCPVCGVCPQPFGICVFVLILIIVAAVILILLALNLFKKKCDRCGHTNWKSASVCKHCGHPLVKRHVPSVVVPAYAPKVEPRAKRERENNLPQDGVYCIRCGVPLDKGTEVCFNCGTNQNTNRR